MKHRGSFLAGMVTAVLILALGTTVLAAAGKVSFNFANIALDGEVQVAAGADLTAANGQKVPGSIVYTDEAGGTTNYLPIRTIADLLGVEIGYDAATKTVYLGEQPAGEPLWNLEIDGRKLLYYCGEEGHTYSAPPAFRPTWEEDGWGLLAISQDTRNYMSRWRYQSADGSFELICAYPSTAGIGRQLDSEAAANSRQTVTVQGYRADYYQDGNDLLLVWENADHLLLFLRGTDVAEKTLFEVAESVALCSGEAEDLHLNWLPSGYALLDHYEIADTVMENWVKDNVTMSWMYSAAPLRLPDWESTAVEVGGVEACYWEALEPYESDDASEAADGITTIDILGLRSSNTLAWQDPDTGVYFRLQSILDQEAMLRIAENIK